LRLREVEETRVLYTAKALRERLKAAGGRWSPEEKLWRVRYGKISGTTLGKHIHIDESG
jgi:hypothetical protein